MKNGMLISKVFLFTYALFEIPSQVVLRKSKPHINYRLHANLISPSQSVDRDNKLCLGHNHSS